MKIIHTGFVPDNTAWMEKRFKCSKCATIVEPGPEDKERINSYEDKPDLKSTLVADCPKCLQTQLFVEVWAPEALPDLFIPPFL